MEQVRFLEQGETEEAEFNLVDGRVRVDEVLKNYGASMVMVKLEGDLYRLLTPASDDLSGMRFEPGSFDIAVVRRVTIPRVLPGQRVEKLLSLFQKQLKVAREPVLDLPLRRRAETLPLTTHGTLYRSLGTYFMVAGREDTLEMQIKGAAKIFCTFMSHDRNVRECDSLLMAVGFPGVGKTTLGLDTTALLHKLWEEDPSRVSSILHEVLSPSLVDEFVRMVEDSKGFHSRMYCSLDSSGDGQPLHEERGLGESQLLALNTLFASLTPDDSNTHSVDILVTTYLEFLHRLEVEFPGIKEQLVFDDVVTFIRRGLGILDGTRILLSWFFDEANVARPAPGRTVSWFQEMMSRLVRWTHNHRRGHTFVVATAATTRFSVATLQNTASGRVHSVFIPLRPLSLEEGNQVVLKFLERLSRTVDGHGDVHLTDGLKDAISISGGNPRMLSYILTAFCTSSAAADLDPADLLARLTQPLLKEDMERVILQTWKLIQGNYYARYVNSDKMRLVLRALQASLLGVRVKRVELVLPGIFEDNWGDLESTGLVGLTNRTVESGVTASDMLVSVSFSAMVLRYVFSLTNDTLSKLLPPLESSDWKVKEKADLYTIMFMILLHKEVTGRDTFRLVDILPQHWFVPAALSALEFMIPSADLSWLVAQTGQLKSPYAFWAYMDQNPDRWAFIGLHNWGADSWLKLVCARTGKVILVVLESKCCANPQVLPVVDYFGDDGILAKAEKDLKSIVSGSKKRKHEDGGTSTAPITFGYDQIVFLYMSDQDVKAALEHHQVYSASSGGVAARLIIGNDLPSESPLSKMSAVRHMMVFTRKD